MTSTILHVVRTHDLPVRIIVGKELLQNAELTIRSNKIISLKPIPTYDDDDKHFLLNTRVDDEQTELPESVPSDK